MMHIMRKKVSYVLKFIKKLILFTVLIVFTRTVEESKNNAWNSAKSTQCVKEMTINLLV